MPAKHPTTNVERLMQRSVEQIVRNGAAIRHAEAALKTGRVAEALVVLEAALNGDHLRLPTLNALVEAKEEELLEAANMADEKSLLEAYLAHRP